MAYTQEELEKAVNAAMNISGRYDSYELDGTTLTSHFKSNSGKMERSVIHDFDDGGEITGRSSCTLSEHYPGDSAGFGLASLIRDALENPEDFELFDKDSGKRIYPDDEEQLDAGADSLINYDVVKKGALVTIGAAFAGYAIHRFAPKIKARFAAWRQKRKGNNPADATADSTAVAGGDESDSADKAIN